MTVATDRAGSRRIRAAIVMSGLVACWAVACPARAEMLTNERGVGDLRLGQRVLVDDGTCPAGQIKEITGANLTTSGVNRVRKCVPRKK
jgi:hypothetical protein